MVSKILKDDFVNYTMYNCNTCDAKFTIRTELWYHQNIECPNRRTISFHIGNSGTIPSKKNSDCYRCGRQGHYYLDKECYDGPWAEIHCTDCPLYIVILCGSP